MTPTPDAPHPEYTSTALAWVKDGAVHWRGALVVQCPVVDHEHTTDLDLTAKTVTDPEVGLAWMVIARGPGGMTALAAARTCAEGLAKFLPGAPTED